MAMERAVFIDCRTLIENFVKSGNPRFESFCVQWKRMMFQHIYSAQSTNVELLQTTKAALNAGKRTVCARGENANWGDEEQQLLRRIGGMFLLYVIYQKQPTEKYVKIEVSPETWSGIKTFIEELPTALATDDVRYVYWRLMQMHAFRFTALDYCVGLENLVDYDKVDENETDASGEHEDGAEMCSGSKLKESLPQFGATLKILPALTILEDGYNEMKEMLVTAEGSNRQALPPTNIFKNIRNSFVNIQKMLDDCKSSKTAIKPKTNSDKRNLKRKGYKVTHSNDDIEIDSSEYKKGKKSLQLHRRMSVRTIFSDQLPDEMLSDLQEEDDGEADDNDDDEQQEDDESRQASEAQKSNDNNEDDEDNEDEDVNEIINSITILEKYKNRKRKVK